MGLFYPREMAVYGNLTEKYKNIGAFAENICKQN